VQTIRVLVRTSDPRRRLLLRVAVRCNVLQCVAMCCNVLQCVAVCCSVLHCVAVCCRLAFSLVVRELEWRSNERFRFES